MEYAGFKEDRVKELYNMMWQVAADINHIAVEEAKRRFQIRKVWAEDWDTNTSGDYSHDWSTDQEQLTAGSAYIMNPIDKFEVVGLYGWHNGNCDYTIRWLRVKIGTEIVREYFGFELASELNGIYIFDDPIFATKTQPLYVYPYTESGSATSRANPLGWVIKAK